MFIHPLDTAIELLDCQERPQVISIQKIEEQQLLKQVQVQLQTNMRTALVSMNLVSGANLEMIQAMGNKSTQVLTNLTTLETYTDNHKLIKKFSDWDSTLYKRGFVTLLESFIESIQQGKQSTDSLKRALYSHEICHEILNA